MATRHDVNMEVRHALADHVIDCQERAFGSGRSGQGPRQALRQGEERPHFGDRQIGKGRDMRPGHEQNVAGQEGEAIEECDPRCIVEDDLGGRIAADDGAENARATAGAVTWLELNVENHGALSREWLVATRRNR